MESEFLNRLHTNYVPSDGEIERIRKNVVLQVKELERLDNLIRDLSSQRDKIGAYVDSHKALISIPRRLPRDLIQEIFLACLPTDRNAAMSLQEAPLLLCRICSAWRDIALSTPRLWASLHIPFPFLVGHERRMRALVQWLERSAACPLSLSLAGDHLWNHRWPATSSRERKLEDVDAIMELLIRNSTRWRQMEMASFRPETLLQLGDVHAPMLEVLKVSGELPQTANDEHIDVLSGRGLRELTLSSWTLAVLVPDMVWPRPVWDQLTHLSIALPNFSGWNTPFPFKLLKITPRLVSLRCGPHCGTTLGSLPEPVSLPFLTTFIILDPFGGDTHSLDRLFEKLWMPELRQLALPMYVNTTNILDDLRQKSPCIKCLRCPLQPFVNGVLGHTSTFLSFLAKVELIGLRRPQVQVDDLLQLFAPGPHLPRVCPALAELIVEDCPLLSEQVLQAFLQRQIDMSTDFQRLELRFFDEPQLKYDVASFRARGLDVALKMRRLPEEVPVTPWEGLPVEAPEDTVGDWIPVD